MNDPSTTVPTAQTRNQLSNTRSEFDSLEVFAQELGKEIGRCVGSALAEEIHENEEIRRAAATGAGIGFGVVVGIAFLAVLAE